MFAGQAVDVNKIFELGHQTFQLSEADADALLAEMKRETMMRVISNSNWERGYKNRYMSKRSLHQPKSVPEVYRQYNTQLLGLLRPVLQFYRGADSLDNVTTCAFAGREGFYMDQHIDVGDRSVFDVILYLGSDIQTESDGGFVEFKRVEYDDTGRVVDRRMIASIKPCHGLVLVFNNMIPTISHGVTKLCKPGAVRYTLISTIGAKHPPDWYFDFEEAPGCFLDEAYMMATDEDWAVQQRLKELELGRRKSGSE